MLGGMPRRSDLLASVLPIARALRRLEDRAASAHGITMWQYAALAVADARPRCSQAEIVAVLDYSANRIIGDIDRLEELGLARRVAGRDRRRHEIEITDAGRERMLAVRRDIHRAEDDLFAGIDPDDRRQFGALASRFAATIGADDRRSQRRGGPG
jgi:DNA-binding MarR family transcriptional regulator